MTPFLSPVKITKEEISILPIEEYTGRIIVVDHPADVKPAVEALSANRCVGFDTETRPNFRKDQHHKVSLMQVATDRVCYLFRLTISTCSANVWKTSGLLASSSCKS